MKNHIWALMLCLSYSCSQPPELLRDIHAAADATAEKSDSDLPNDVISNPSEGTVIVKSEPSGEDMDPVPVVVPEPEPVVIVKPYTPCP
ncbi:MAG: hypothetical protein EOP07_23640, partial [Proteobacteria bacterium]